MDIPASLFDDSWFMTMQNRSNNNQQPVTMIIINLADDTNTILLTNDAGTQQLTNS